MSSGQASAAQAEAKADAPASSTLRLSLDEALAFFFRQNLDLITVRFGIDSARGQQITAGLFPNPVLSIGSLSSFQQNYIETLFNYQRNVFLRESAVGREITS